MMKIALSFIHRFISNIIHVNHLINFISHVGYDLLYTPAYLYSKYIELYSFRTNGQGSDLEDIYCKKSTAADAIITTDSVGHVFKV